MKLWEIFRFEIGYQSRRASTWLYFAILLLLTRYMTMELSTEFASDGTFFHAPFVIAAATVGGSLIGLLVAAALAGDAATRDVQARIDPLLYSSPVTKGAHLAGRFLAAFGLQALILLAVPLALLLAAFVPPPDARLVGPFRPIAYLAACAVIGLPNAFIATAFLFSIAALSRRAMMSYFGALLLGGTCAFSYAFVAATLGRWQLAKLLDPFGATVLGELSMVWTPAERSTRLIGPQSVLLLNRVLWIGIAFGVLALTHRWYRLAHHAPGAAWYSLSRRSPRAGDGLKPRRTPTGVGERRGSPIVVPGVRRTFGFVTHARQTLAIARDSFQEIMTSWGAVGLAAIAALAVASGMEGDFMGVPLVATTERISAVLSAPFPRMIVPLLITFYAGELVWRERDARVSEITDAAPVPEWVSFLGKFAGLSLVLVALQVVMVGSGMLIQAFWNHYDFEIALYARILFGFQLVDYLLLALLACVVHTLVNHKYVGHLLVVIAYVFITFPLALGIEHNLLVYGSDPGWIYSDMRGFEPFVGAWLWFKCYWAAWALLLAVGARLFWVRGKEADIGSRLGLARDRLTRPTAWVAAAVLTLILTQGGFIFYNTNVVNAYQTAAAGQALRAEYERRYGQYKGIPQPQLTGTNLRVEIYPDRREVEIRGAFHLLNTNAIAIDAIHLATKAAVDTTAVRFDRAVKNVVADERLGHRVYALETPLHAGESLRLDFDVRFKPRGFTNRGIDASVVANGTYFTNEAWLPVIGYQAERELRSPGERQAFGLVARPAIPPLDDRDARRDVGRAARVAFEAVVGTDWAQVAIAPGRLRRTWTENGRRYFHYATDAPIRNDYAFFSAAYAVHEARWNDVSIEIFHHPHHAWNVPRIVRSVQASLDYYTRVLGPYPHGQVRFVEHPGDSIVLHAAPINVAYDERFSLLDPQGDPRGLDLPFAVVAHEMAHQWWGNTLTPAEVEGAGVLTETLAWYSAMGVVEQALGREHLPRLLRMMREVYLIPDTRANVPLLRAADRFLAYRKGPFAMYALREYVGAEQVNAALRRLLEWHGAGAPPLPTSLDLYRELQAVTPESLRSLLVDLFERNTFWELATDRATAEQTKAGEWQVILDVRARKVLVDEDGVETELPMDDQIEVGVFASSQDRALGDALYLQRHRVRSGEQRITVVVPRRPAQAGIDPRRLLIDVEDNDNLREITRRNSKTD